MTVDSRSSIVLGPTVPDVEETSYRPFRYQSADGLSLEGRLYGDLGRPGLPLVCLSGLTRNSRDFEPVARRFAGERAVVTLDFRGRGGSDRDPNPARYAPPVEAGDVLTGLDALGIARAVFLGTSRGGIVTMLLATMRPALVAGAILNDIGPVIERRGLLRIKAHVGMEPPGDWETATRALAAAWSPEFPILGADAYARIARRLYRDDDGRPVLDYDPALALNLAPLGPTTPLPDVWGPFAALDGKPLLVLRAEHSDILAAKTVADMAERHPGLASLTVAGQGHAPLLEDEPSLEAVAALLGRADRGATSTT